VHVIGMSVSDLVAVATATCLDCSGGCGTWPLNGGTLEEARAIAAHESPKTTKLDDRTADAITLGEVERIVI